MIVNTLFLYLNNFWYFDEHSAANDKKNSHNVRV